RQELQKVEQIHLFERHPIAQTKGRRETPRLLPQLAELLGEALVLRLGHLLGQIGDDPQIGRTILPKKPAREMEPVGQLPVCQLRWERRIVVSERPPIEPEDRLPPAPHSSGAPPAENLAGRLAGLGLKKALQICFEIALQIRPARRKLQPYPTEGREMVERELEMMLELLPEPRELVASECVRNDRHYAPVVVPHQLFDVLLHKGLRQIAVDLERGMAAGGCGALENFGLPG